VELTAKESREKRDGQHPRGTGATIMIASTSTVMGSTAGALLQRTP
jgi:hypothetical protein